MRIGFHDTDERVLVVAEIGNNHEGDPAVARELIHAAAEAGCDAAKLQVFTVERFVRPTDGPRREQLTGFRLGDDVVLELLGMCGKLGMAAVATPLDLPSLDLVEPHVDALKIASGDNDHVPLLARAGSGPRPVIVSAGLANAADVERAVAAVRRARDGSADALAVLHCVSAYPAPDDAVNLAAIGSLARRLDVVVGYSDHTLGVEVAPVAAAAGARIVEKHLTLDRDQSDFRDHQLSAEPEEMAELVAAVRRVELLLGSAEKRVQAAEEPLLVAARRSIVARHDLRPGQVLTLDDLDWMRPRDGIEPGREDEVIGRRVREPVAAGEALCPAELG